MYSSSPNFAEEDIDLISKEMIIDRDLLSGAPEGRMVIKVAGNMAYPMGLRTEKIAEEILSLSRQSGLPLKL